MKRLLPAVAFVLSLLGGHALAETLTFTTYYHNDHLGNPVAATDERGDLLWRAHFTPYGERYENPAANAFGTVGYTGHAQDKASGLVYMGARYYDPVIGRFMAVDPVGVVPTVPGSFNRYAYVQGNPYRFTDPNGAWAEDAVIGALSISMGAYSLGNNIENNQWGAAAVDLGGIVLDIGAAAVPLVPGGAGLAIQASRKIGAKGAEATADAGSQSSHYIPEQELAKQRVNGQDIPLPLAEAEGRPHTVLGGKTGSNGERYRQSAEFPAYTWPKVNGMDVPLSEVHWSSHGRGDHANPHQHPFVFDGKGWLRSGGNGIPFGGD